MVRFCTALAHSQICSLIAAVNALATATVTVSQAPWVAACVALFATSEYIQFSMTAHVSNRRRTVYRLMINHKRKWAARVETTDK